MNDTIFFDKGMQLQVVGDTYPTAPFRREVESCPLHQKYAIR